MIDFAMLVAVLVAVAAVIGAAGAAAVAQFMYGDPLPILAPVLTAQAVASGDIVALSGGNVIRAQDFTWTTDLATTQTNFAAAFLGVSGQDKVAGTARVYANQADNLIGVSTGGVWEFDCTLASYAVGDYVGPAKDTGNNLLSQKVEAVAATEARAIGKVERAGTNLTRVRVRLLSKVLPTARQT